MTWLVMDTRIVQKVQFLKQTILRLDNVDTAWESKDKEFQTVGVITLKAFDYKDSFTADLTKTFLSDDDTLNIK